MVSLAVALAALLLGCAELPPLHDRPVSHAVQPSAEGSLGRAVLALASMHPGQTGIVPVDDGRLAIGVRLAYARSAARSIDIQTFVWHNDAAGTLLFSEVMAAAERGVRVRLLLDDFYTQGLDPTLALLAAQPNLEVRLYNPFVSRGSRIAGMLSDFARLNRRMHNKSFIVDNVLAVVGGRNIGDEYFETAAGLGFVDFDVIAIGEAVTSLSQQFDLYWNSDSAYPASMILARVQPEHRDALARRVQLIQESPTTAKYIEAITRTEAARRTLAGVLDPEWTTATVLYDNPAKTLRPTSTPEHQMLPQLLSALGQTVTAIDVISPYFVPGEAGIEALSALARRGVRVRVVTNSLAATDVKIVHCGYLKSRVALLQAGVQLYELKPDASIILDRASEVGIGATAGLHAKTYQVDGRAIFVGSFNLDPRSIDLNTEMGLVLHSPALASKLVSAVDAALPSSAYHVSLDGGGKLVWTDAAGELYDSDPGTSWALRTMVRIGSWLPFDWLL